jgi:hypothetical protein
MEDRIQRQKRIINEVLQRYNAAAGTACVVTRWPDEEDREARACDAYAEGPSHVPLAIEHTIIPTFELQKQHDAQVMKAIGDLEAELKRSFPHKLSLAIPMLAIQKGQKWSVIRAAIKEWLLNNAAAIPAGRSSHSIPGVPFEISLDRDDDLEPLFTVARWLDSSLDVPDQLAGRIAAALADKDQQLVRYHKDGNRTLLILES